ncbi:MAG: metallophosphoesterase [Acidobacteriota bacterium]|nr:metallophosphoesterase [Acidobacteriota bacterium]
MAHIHREPYIVLSGLTHESALITWGGFFFDITGEEVDGRFKIIADKDLKHINPPRKNSIGESSAFYGPARVTVREKGGGGQPVVVEVAGDKPETRVNYAWARGLKPDTEYVYALEVKGEPWADEERRDWVFRNGKQGMFTNKGRYVNEFRTHPRPDQQTPDFVFAVIGDFGRGVKSPSTQTSRQREVAAALARAVEEKGVRFVLTTGDNIYAGGGSDSDWFFAYYQPYRYILNRIPVYPSCGNHDTGESEGDASDEFSDDYDELLDNFYIRQRFLTEDDEGDGVKENGLFYTFKFGRDFEFFSIDTSKQRKQQPRSFERPDNLNLVKGWLPNTQGHATTVWRVPFFHHPAFCYGPEHGDTQEVIDKLVPVFEGGGVRLVLCGHEHNLQALTRNQITYLLTGGAGEVRPGNLSAGAQENNVAWSPTPHFLLCEYKGAKLRVTPYGELVGGALAPLNDVKDPQGNDVTLPFVVTLT